MGKVLFELSWVGRVVVSFVVDVLLFCCRKGIPFRLKLLISGTGQIEVIQHASFEPEGMGSGRYGFV